MIEAIFIAAIILLSTAQNLLCKLYTVSYSGKSTNSAAVYAMITGIVTAISAFGIYGFSFRMSPMTFLLGVINSLFGILLDYSLIKISQTGPYSVQMVFLINGGILIPTAVSMCFGDYCSWIKIIAIIALFPAVYLISCKKDETFADKKTFFTYCFLAAIGNGGFLSMLDVQQRITGAEEKNAMVYISYFFLALISAVWLFCINGTRIKQAFSMPRKALYFLIGSAAVIAVAINAKVYMLPLVSTVLLYAFDNAGTLLLSVLCSCLFWGDRMSKKNCIGCGMLILMLVLISFF